MLNIARNSTNQFFYDNTTLNKMFIARMYTEEYGFLLYQHSVSVLYLNMYDIEDATHDNATIKFMDDCNELCILPSNEFVEIPAQNAGSDEWFNFNIQYSSLGKDDFYPVLDGLCEILRNEYNRVFLKMLGQHGLK